MAHARGKPKRKASFRDGALAPDPESRDLDNRAEALDSGFAGKCPRPGMTVRLLIQPVQRMQRAHRQFGMGGVDRHRELDLRR